MGQTAVRGTRIHQVAHSQLPNFPESLHQRVLQKVKKQGIVEPDEAVDRVVDDLVFVHVNFFFQSAHRTLGPFVYVA